MSQTYDFAGWATRNNLKCSDGRTIMKDAFKHCDGQTVPLVWSHQHKEPYNVLGHALLENREDGVYAYGTFNDTENGRLAKELVEHGDIHQLSIYANQLRQQGGNVLHGAIREVSLVHAGANPGAFIETVIRHSDDGDPVEVEDEGILYTGECLSLYHADTEEKEKEEMSEENKTPAAENEEETLSEVFETLTEKQKNVVYALIANAADAADEDDNEEDDDDEVEHSEGGDNTMKYNIFDREEVAEGGVLTHADQEAILELAKKPGVGSFKQALAIYAEENESLAHGLDLGDTETLAELLPDHKLLNPGAPEILRDDQSWVMGVINKIHKSPYARIRTRYAEARIKELKTKMETLRAKGYKKGEEKTINKHIQLIGRKTEPTTVYIKDELNRDDIVDITDFDVVAYTWGLMKDNLYETLALSALVGDGREPTDNDKINEANIRPIWKDEEAYTHHVDVDIEKARQELQGSNTSANFGENYIYAEAIITAALYARETFKGSGTPDLYCTPHLVNVMLLARDLNGRRIYDSKADLARALNVKSIVEIEQLEGLTRTQEEATETSKEGEKELLGLFVNLADYQFGSTKGGEITKFDDFDIDFNKYKYLMETRLSGALVKLDSAIALELPAVEAQG